MHSGHIALVASSARQLLWSNLKLVLLQWEQQPLGRGSRHFLEESGPLARARIKELSLRDLAARAQQQQ